VSRRPLSYPAAGENDDFPCGGRGGEGEVCTQAIGKGGF